MLPPNLVLAVSVLLRDPTPAPNDVKAGWTAFALFILGIAAVVVLSMSFRKQLRKTQAARDAGVFDDPAEKDSPSER